jgi:hypothetical protein
LKGNSAEACSRGFNAVLLVLHRICAGLSQQTRLWRAIIHCRNNVFICLNAGFNALGVCLGHFFIFILVMSLIGKIKTDKEVEK